jgi:hypothetical protein
MSRARARADSNARAVVPNARSSARAVVSIDGRDRDERRRNRSIDRAARGARRRPRDGLRRFPTASPSRARRADAVVEQRTPIRI